MPKQAQDFDALQAAVGTGRVSGVVACAVDAGSVLYEDAYGWRSPARDVAMTIDSVFWIASMTKAITGVAVMQLVEQGRLELDDPIQDILPELAAPQVLEGFTAGGEPILRPARHVITLRHLLSHTSGFSYHMWNPDIARYMERAGVPDLITCKNEALRTPLMFDPGTGWEYGINFEWAGKAVEAVSGLSLEHYFREHITGPLGMNDTSFLLGPSQRSRLTAMATRQDDGELVPLELEVTQTPEFFMGGGGLYGTVPDYARFLQMLLNDGSLQGVQILRPDTVAMMAQNQIGDLEVGKLTASAHDVTKDVEFFAGMPKKFGLGYLINTEDSSAGRSAGSIAWAGLTNTYFWLDPVKRVAGVIMMQMFPFADPAALELLDSFERQVYRSLRTRPFSS